MKKTLQATVLVVSFLLFLIFAFKNNAKQKPDDIVISPGAKEASCFTKAEMENALEAILQSEGVQYFIHPEYDGVLPLKLLKSDLITPDLKIESNRQAIVFRDSLIPDGNVHRIRFLKMDCELKTADYSVWYPLEHGVTTGTVYKRDSSWEVSNSSWGIID